MTLALHGKSKRRQAGLLASALMAVVMAAVGGVLWLGMAKADSSSVNGAVNTSTSDGTVQNGNTKYTDKCQVYLRAAQQGNSNLGPDGTWYIRVTEPSANNPVVLTPSPGYFKVTVYQGKFTEWFDTGDTPHPATNNVVPLCAIGTYADTTIPGGVYKAWASFGDTTFASSNSKTDNFKVKVADPTISKSQSQVSQDPTKFYWSISVNNPASADQTVQITDAGATFFAQTSPNPASGTCTGLGVDCTVKAKQTLVIGVSKPKPAATCSPQPVGNTATLSVVDGQTVTQVGSSTATPDFIVPASTGAECASKGTLTVRKVGNFSAGVVIGGFSGPITGPSSSTWHADVDGHDSKTVTAGTGYAVSETTDSFPLNVTGGTVTGAKYKVLAAATDECGTDGFSATSPSNLTVATGVETVVCVQNTFAETQNLTRQVTIKKIVTNVSNDPTTFAITRDGGTPVGNVSETTPLGPIDLDLQKHTFVETVTSGYTLVDSFFTEGSNASCEDAQLAAEAIVGPVEIPADGSWTVCFINEKNAPQTRTIRIGKVTASGSHPQEFFSGTISPGTPTSFNLNLPANQDHGPISKYEMANQNGQTVTETNVPANWAVNGYTVKADADGTGTCSSTENYVGTSAAVPAGSGNYLVCIRNTYTPPPPPLNPCPDGCQAIILNVPTPTPVPPTVVPPTPTVAPPTATPTKVSVVLGEKTPGAVATPLAPSTGSGPDDGGASTNLFLALIGILSLSGGLALLGYGRRAR